MMNGTRTFIARTSRGLIRATGDKADKSAFCLADLASERASECRGAKMERAVTRSHWPTNGTKSSGSVNVPA